MVPKLRSSSRHKPSPTIVSDQLAKDHRNGLKASKDAHESKCVHSMVPKLRSSSRQKPSPNIASDQLAKDHENGKKASKDVHESKGVQAEERGTKDICIHEGIGGNRAHVLVVHFGESKWEEIDFRGKISFLDVLNICKKFIDIYSVGVVITDLHGKPLKNDGDLQCLLKEQEHVENISIYLDVDATAQPLAFELPQDNPSYACVPESSQVRDATTEDDIISETESETEFEVESETEFEAESEGNDTKDPASGKVRNVRGKNKNKKILALKDGEKLEIQFYNYRGVGPNHKCWSRHLGKIVRDRHICPVRVHTWKEMPDLNKQLMWLWAKEYFSNPDMESYREHTLEHMGALWTSWRSILNVKYMKPCETIELALKNVPPGMDVKDWEWLVTEKFSSDEFQEVSARNSNNRVNGVLPHRSGSQPHRHIIYEMGGKIDNPPDVAKIFYATRQKNGKLDAKDQEKYDEIVETVEANASLSQIEVVEICFGPQNHSTVFGFGGGIKRKHFGERKLKKRKHSNGIEAGYTTEPEAGYTTEPEAAYTTETKAAYIKEVEAKLHEQDEEPCVPNMSKVEDVTAEDDISSETGSESEFDVESDDIGKNMEDSVPEKVRKVRGENKKTVALKCGEKLQKVRNGRGKNKNTKILALKDGEKREIQFYNNRGVGPNHKCWSRHLGKIVRDGHICPVRVYTWKEMPDVNKQHMWDWVKEYFYNPDMELYREHTLEHMGSLWMAWRSLLNVKYMKPCETIELALKNVPPGMDVKDWEWLVTEKFSSDEFQELSARNSNNRAKGVMPPRTETGSQPYRHMIYEMVGKADTPSDIPKIFYAIRQKNGKLDPRDKEIYDEIVKTVEANPSLLPVEVVDTCFGPQNHSDRKRKKMKHSYDAKSTEPETSYSTEHKSAFVKELEAKIHEQDEERKNLIARVEEIERRLIRMENANRPTYNVPTACGDDQPTSNDPSTFGE